jgi:hypothetical protein
MEIGKEKMEKRNSVKSTDRSVCARVAGLKTGRYLRLETAQPSG